MKPDFDEVYDSTAPEVYRYLRRLTGSRVQAEDLLQETFLKLHQQLTVGEPPQNTRAWLFRVATNLAKNKRLSQLRANLREGRYSASSSVVDFQARVEDQQIIRRVLAKLPPRMRQVLLLSAEGFTYQEISHITGIEAGYVGVLLQRARASFKQHFEEQNKQRYESQAKQRQMR